MMPVSNPNSRTAPLHPVAGGLVQRGIAHDAALADLALAHFELRFDQYNHLPAGLEQRRRCAGRISVTEMKLTSQTTRSTGSPMSSNVSSRALMPSCSDHARIGAQLPIELARADIDGMHARRAGLQQASR